MAHQATRLAPGEEVNFTTHLILKASDGAEFALPREAAKQGSTAVSTTLPHASAEEKVVFPVETDADSLAVVVAYLAHHFNNEAAKIGKPLPPRWKENLSEWDKALLASLGSEQELQDGAAFNPLLKVLQAADQLGVSSLKTLLSAWIASVINTVTSSPQSNVECAELIRKLFQVDRGYSDAEYAEALAVNAWAGEGN